MVTALQAMVTRRFDVFDPVVVTVGVFNSGTRRNVIPDDVRFEATVRAFTPAISQRVGDHAVRLCQGIAAAHGLTVEARYEQDYPALVNNPEQYEFVARTVRDVFGPERFTELPNPLTGSEDFSRVLQAVPGAFVFLGACTAEDPATAPTNHSPLASFDDSVLADGAALLAELAARRLR
jgi:hippurate hydrolase